MIGQNGDPMGGNVVQWWLIALCLDEDAPIINVGIYACIPECTGSYLSGGYGRFK